MRSPQGRETRRKRISPGRGGGRGAATRSLSLTLSSQASARTCHEDRLCTRPRALPHTCQVRRLGTTRRRLQRMFRSHRVNIEQPQAAGRRRNLLDTECRRPASGSVRRCLAQSKMTFRKARRTSVSETCRAHPDTREASQLTSRACLTAREVADKLPWFAVATVGAVLEAKLPVGTQSTVFQVIVVFLTKGRKAVHFARSTARTGRPARRGRHSSHRANQAARGPRACAVPPSRAAARPPDEMVRVKTSIPNRTREQKTRITTNTRSPAAVRSLRRRLTKGDILHCRAAR